GDRARGRARRATEGAQERRHSEEPAPRRQQWGSPRSEFTGDACSRALASGHSSPAANSEVAVRMPSPMRKMTAASLRDRPRPRERMDVRTLEEANGSDDALMRSSRSRMAP